MPIDKPGLKNAMRPLLQPCWTTRASYAGFADETYHLPTQQELMGILNQVNLPAPAGDLFDCDDYSFLLRGDTARIVRNSNAFPDPLCLGIAWGRFNWIGGGNEDHACNWVFMQDRTFYWIEGQTRTLYGLNSCLPGTLTLLLI